MTTIDIDKMVAGRELNKLVHKEIFDNGYWNFRCPNCGSTHFGSSGQDGGTSWTCHDGCHATFTAREKCFPDPDFSGEIEWAWKILEEMAYDGFKWRISNPFPDTFDVCFWKDKGIKVEKFGYVAGSVPLAICKAALMRRKTMIKFGEGYSRTQHATFSSDDKTGFGFDSGFTSISKNKGSNGLYEFWVHVNSECDPMIEYVDGDYPLATHGYAESMEEARQIGRAIHEAVSQNHKRRLGFPPFSPNDKKS